MRHRQMNFCFRRNVARSPAGPNHPTISWVPKAPSRGQRGRGVKMATHLNQDAETKKGLSYASTPHTRISSRRGA
jgi:hypothetical protein